MKMADMSCRAPIPATLEQQLRSRRIGPVHREGMIAFPFHWQVPAATEKAAYEAVAASVRSPTFDYVGFPWATVIDGLRGDAVVTASILMALKSACDGASGSRARVTVAQHIHALQFLYLFRACGITDLFWSHATRAPQEVDGVRLHPFPLFPAQTPTGATSEDPDRPRRFLANFIGAYNPNLYLTKVREVIFSDPNELGDLLIVRRTAWHFDRAVYEEQIRGVPADASRLQKEQREAAEYLDAIGQSWFTLCPTGSGPNSIRIFESLCLGSIPIILTRDLRLAGPRALWEQAAIVEEDSADGYRRALVVARAMPQVRRIEMLRAGQALWEHVRPSAYHRLVTDAMASVTARSKTDH
jgi:hypothetical protein